MFQPEFSLPVAQPLRFFRIAPLWLALAALLALGLDAEIWQQRFAPPVLAITHLLMLGFVGNIMLGALLQVCAVLAGVRIARRGSELLWLALQSGTGLLAYGLWQMQPLYLQFAAGLLLTGLATLAIGLLIALRRSQTASPLRWPMAGLLLTVISGSLLVSLLTTGHAPLPLGDLLRAHIALGTIAWIASLISVVAFTVVPMFLVAPALPGRLNRYLPPTLFAAVLFALLDSRWLALLAIPLLFWFLALLQSLRKSQRQADPARYLWLWGGFNLLLCPLLIAWQTVQPASASTAVALGLYWLFAGVMPIITAMLAKIIPFLLWMDFRLQIKTGGGLRHMGQLFPEQRLRKLAFLVFTIGIAIYPLYLFAFKAIPLIVLGYALLLCRYIERAISSQKRACIANK